MERLSNECLKEIAKLLVNTALPRMIAEKRGENRE